MNKGRLTIPYQEGILLASGLEWFSDPGNISPISVFDQSSQPGLSSKGGTQMIPSIGSFWFASSLKRQSEQKNMALSRNLSHCSCSCLSCASRGASISMPLFNLRSRRSHGISLRTWMSVPPTRDIQILGYDLNLSLQNMHLNW